MRSIIYLLLACLSTITLGAEVLEEKIGTVALFKNGNAFFISTLDVPEGISEFEFIPQVAPSHGTFWLSWQDGAELSNIIAQELEMDKNIDAVTIAELLKANVGQRVRLKLSCEDEYVTGKLISFDRKKNDDKIGIYRPGKRSESGYYPPYFDLSYVTVETDTGICVFDVNRITAVNFLTKQINRQTTELEKKVALKGEFAAESKQSKLYISYLGRGISWAPSYIVDITDSDSVILSAKSVIINEAADIKNARILLITGYPQLEFGHIDSPMSMKNSLSEFLAALGSQPSARGGAVTENVMMARSQSFKMMDSAAGEPVNYGGAAQGKQLEEMFFYPVEEVSLMKDQTGYYPLFSQKVECKHIYKWDIEDNIDRYSRYNMPQDNREDTVWHCIKLSNEMDMPWTAAPIQTVKDGLILGQSTLDYTLAGDDTVVKITRAPAVKANQVEFVSERVSNAATFFGVNYDQVTIEGKLYISNTKNVDVDIEISKLITGKLIESNPQAKSKTTITNVGQINESQQLEWKLGVTPGSETEIKYTYKAYLRR